MATDLEIKAKEAFIDDHFEMAVDLYSQAIAQNPNNAELFSDRAQANIKLNNFTGAVTDANKAIELDPSISKAYLRKATACMKLEEYQTAKAALEAGASLAPGEARFINLIKECEERIAEETGELPNPSLEDAPTNVVSMEEAPEETGELPNPSLEDAPTNVVSMEDAPTNVVSMEDAPTNVVSTEDVLPADDNPDQVPMVISAPKPKYRHEFYQKPEEVVVTIFAKGIPARSVFVDYGEQILSVTIDVPGEDVYHFQPRLFGKIIPEKCKYDVLATKVEIRLTKAEPIQWTSLEYSKEITVLQRANVPTVGGSQRPAYPSSKPRKDWDKIEAQVKKEEKEEKLDGDAALNKFFRDIYQDADEDTRRAMRKSFVESNGTVLSTNWKEVGSKKVEGSPPDGMEMKKWEY